MQYSMVPSGAAAPSVQDHGPLIACMTAAADFEGFARSGWSTTAMASAAASLALVHSWNPGAAASMRAVLTMPSVFGGPPPTAEQLHTLDSLVNQLAASACGAAAAASCSKTHKCSAQSQYLMQQFGELLLEAQYLLGLQQYQQSRTAQQSAPGHSDVHSNVQAQQLAGLLRHLST